MKWIPSALLALLASFALSCTDGPQAGGQTGSELSCQVDSECEEGLGDDFRCSTGGMCVDATIGSCFESVDCAVVPPDCGSGEYPGVVDGCYIGQCIAEIECEATGVSGSCFAPVDCAAEPPVCGSGEYPGVIDGCYSGECIPQVQCETPDDCLDC